MSTKRLEVADIEQVWDWVEPALKRIAERGQHPWTPDEVRSAVHDGSANFLLCPDGFVVWSIRICERTGRTKFWVWVAYGVGGDILGPYEPQIVELARLCGADCIGFSSRRPGYARRLKKPWRAVEYERDV